MEKSRATNCPSVAYQLVGTKKMQQALARPGAVERYERKRNLARVSNTIHVQVHKGYICSCQDKVNICWTLFTRVGVLTVRDDVMRAVVDSLYAGRGGRSKCRHGNERA